MSTIGYWLAFAVLVAFVLLAIAAYCVSAAVSFMESHDEDQAEWLSDVPPWPMRERD